MDEVINFEDFQKVDLRVGEILTARRHEDPKVTKLLILTVDVGEPEPRQILAGIGEAYKPEELVGENVVVVCNLAPRKMRGYESHGMLLAASQNESNAIELVKVAAMAGTKVG